MRAGDHVSHPVSYGGRGRGAELADVPPGAHGTGRGYRLTLSSRVLHNATCLRDRRLFGRAGSQKLVRHFHPLPLFARAAGDLLRLLHRVTLLPRHRQYPILPLGGGPTGPAGGIGGLGGPAASILLPICCQSGITRVAGRFGFATFFAAVLAAIAAPARVAGRAAGLAGGGIAALSSRSGSAAATTGLF